ncbi:MAG TPA: serine/threonine-protein kinase [Kofleriaceae bacterium]
MREPTQSMHVEAAGNGLDADDDANASELAVGTHNRSSTRIKSPAARVKTPQPKGPPSAPRSAVHRRADQPDDYLDAVLGSYRIIDLLGKGGMGYVFRAEHVKLGREVALKLLRSDYASRRDAVARFFQEARTVNRIRHRNIVDVTDFVELDDGTTYIIMELLTGTSLGSWARTGIDLPRALATLVQICDGLAAAHEVGVVHRDLKPDNVIVVPTDDGGELVKLLDFGVAKLLNRDDEDVGFQTAAGSVIGTPAYMSPEQAGGMVIDARSDIYSLGAIMYELFCGQPMFRGRSFGEYVRKHLTEDPTPPRQTPGGGELSPEVEALILRCLDKDPDRRFARIGELREALLHLFGAIETHPPAGGSGMRQLPQAPIAPMVYASWPGGSPPSSGGYAQQSDPPPSRPAPAPRSTPGWLWFIGGALAVAIGTGAAVWYAEHDAPDLGPPPRPLPPAVAVPVGQPPGPRPTPAPLLELRFDSSPSGSVYAEGHAAELCRTPCTFNVDLADGGPTDARTFVVKRDGYTDGVVVVDLASNRHAYSVALAPVAAPEPPAAPAAKPSKPRPTRPTRPNKPRPADKTGIDPSDTLDPFHT